MTLNWPFGGRAIFYSAFQRRLGRAACLAAIIGMWAAMVVCLAFLPIAAAAEANSLINASLGEGPGFTRLSFTFKEPIESYQLRRDDVDLVVVDFKDVHSIQALKIPSNKLISELAFTENQSGLTLSIRLSAVRYEVRHILSRKRHSVAIDFKVPERQSLRSRAENGNSAPLLAPDLAQEARRLLAALPPAGENGRPEAILFRRALGRLEVMDKAGAAEDFKRLLKIYPKNPLAAKAAYLLPEIIFISGQPQDTYAASAQMWARAQQQWPNDELALRGRFMQAEADRLSGRTNEAAAQFKTLAEGIPEDESIYKALAFLRLVDLLFHQGLIDEGQMLLEPVLEKGLPGRLGLEAYVRIGMANFYRGLFSQANEIFLESLKINPGIYLTYPEMLYAAGEAYHYLDRPGLSRGFLLHALSLMPDHPKADVIMARIGDDYRYGADEDSAAAEFRRRRPNDPAQAELMLEEAKNFLAAGQGAKAVEIWNRFRLIYPEDPRNPDLLLIQARQEMKAGRGNDALQSYRKILAQYPDKPRSPEIYLELAAVEIKLNQLTEARRHLEQFNRLFRDNAARPKAFLEQAELSRRLGLIDEAVDIYRRFRQDYPQAPEAPATFLAQARMELAAGREGPAIIETLEEGLLACPDAAGDKAVQRFLSQLYLDFGQEEKWAAMAGRNLPAGPSAGSTEGFFSYSQVAKVYQKQGRYEDAARNYNAALALRPPNLAPEILYAVAKAYQEMNITDKYAEVLIILADSADSMWKAVAEEELAELRGLEHSAPDL